MSSKILSDFARHNKSRYLVAALIASIVSYIPFAGRCFSSDDFFRIRDNMALTMPSLLDSFLTTKSDSFYRPLNHLSFELNYFLFGLSTFDYGLFNFALFASTIALATVLFRRILGPEFGLVAGIALCLSYRSNTMAIHWMVGRTTLLDALFLCLSLLAIQDKTSAYRFFVFPFVMCGLLSKESFVAAPAIVLIFARWIFGYDTRQILRFSLGFAGCLAIYFLLRNHANAMTPSNAPSFYRYDLRPLKLLGHCTAYTFRILVPAGCAAFAGRLVTNGGEPTTGSIPPRVVASVLFMSFLISLAPILPVPSKSNLYIFVPGAFLVGSLLMAIPERFVGRCRTILGRFQLPSALAVYIALILLSVIYQHRKVTGYCKVAELSRVHGCPLPKNLQASLTQPQAVHYSTWCDVQTLHAVRESERQQPARD